MEVVRAGCVRVCERRTVKPKTRRFRSIAFEQGSFHSIAFERGLISFDCIPFPLLSDRCEAESKALGCRGNGFGSAPRAPRARTTVTRGPSPPVWVGGEELTPPRASSLARARAAVGVCRRGQDRQVRRAPARRGRAGRQRHGRQAVPEGDHGVLRDRGNVYGMEPWNGMEDGVWNMGVFGIEWNADGGRLSW